MSTGRIDEGARPDRGLSGHQRLRRSAAFEEAFHSGRRFAGRLLVLILHSGPDASRRLGVVAGRRSFRRAVDRARVKRLLREAYRLNRFRFSGQWDVILIARDPALQVKRQDIERELLALAGRAGLLKAER